MQERPSKTPFHPFTGRNLQPDEGRRPPRWFCWPGHTDSARLSPHDALRGERWASGSPGGSLGKRKIRPGPLTRQGVRGSSPLPLPSSPSPHSLPASHPGTFPRRPALQASRASRAPRLFLVLPPLSWNPRKFHTAWPSGSPLTCLPSSLPVISAAPSRGHFRFLEDGGRLTRLSFLGGGGRLTRPMGPWTQIPKHLHLGARN